MKNNLVKICIVLTGVIICLMITSSKGCVQKSKQAKVGSSADVSTFAINAPSNLSASIISLTEINLSWIDNSNNEDGFEVERSSDGVNYYLEATLYANAVSYVDSGPFSPFNIYYYRVRAMNTVGDRSAYSNTVSISFGWQSMAAGEFHTIALNNGMIWGWGSNFQGQLDPSSNSFTFTEPTLLNSDANWSRIASGYYHTLAIKTDASLWAWGDNEFGELGIGDTEFYSEPNRVGTDYGWSEIAAGEYHSVGLRNSGTLWAWGANTFYQLGLGDTVSRTVPTQIGTDTDWVKITSGGRHVLAIKTDSTLWVWGWNLFYQLGDGTQNSGITPSQVGSDSDWLLASAGYDHTVAVKTNRTLWQWGWQWNTSDYIVTPSQVGADSDWSQIASGGTTNEELLWFFRHNLAVKTNNTLWAWGWNNYNQLGLIDINNRNSPIQIGTASDWVQAAAGGAHSLGRRADGSLWIWGRNNWYQLGLGSSVNEDIPVNISNPQTTALIASVISPTRIDLSWRDNSSRETGFEIERSYDGIDYALISTVNPGAISYSDNAVTRGNTYYYRIRATYQPVDSFGSNVYSPYSKIAVGMSVLWQENIPQDSPGLPLSGSANCMRWNQASKKVILERGVDSTIWWYDPASNTWAEKSAVNPPPARQFESVAWDESGQKLIMFGGMGVHVYENDLWWYEPVSNTWTEKIAHGSGGSPPVRFGQAMVWDPIGGRVIMFGGYGFGPNVYKNDLWWYEPVSNTWIQKIVQNAPGSPAPRRYHTMVWDPITENVIMFGGSYRQDAPNVTSDKNDVWWYDPESNTWTEKISHEQPSVVSARRWHSAVFDPIGNRMVLFGGMNGDNGLYLYDSLPNKWSGPINAAIAPSARYWQSMSWFQFDANSSGVIMFGGNSKNDLWSYLFYPPPLSPPSIIPALTATPVSSWQVDLSWTNVTEENGYKLERKIGVGGGYQQIATFLNDVTVYSDDWLTPNTTYYYRIRAYNSSGDGSYSDETIAITPDGPPARPLTNTATTISSTQISLAWMNVTYEDGYKIERKLGVGGTYSQIATTAADIVTYSDNGLIPDTSYYYKVRANNANGDSDYSPEANATTLPLPPDAPVTLTGTAISSYQVVLTWTDVANETGYKIERKEGAGGTYGQIGTVASDVVTYLDGTGLKSSTEYYYRVRGYNSGGDSGYSPAISATTLVPPPEKPLLEMIPESLANEGLVYHLGYQFTPVVNGKITALGRYANGAGNAIVVLWTDAGAELARVSVTALAGWRWFTLGAPVNVSAGVYYRVSVYCDINGGDYWYGFLAAPETWPILRGNISITQSCYSEGDVFPNITWTDENIWGVADIEFVPD